MTSFDRLLEGGEYERLSSTSEICIEKDSILIGKNAVGAQKIVVSPGTMLRLYLFDSIQEKHINSEITVVHGACSTSRVVRYSILGENAMLGASLRLDIQSGAQDAKAEYLHKTLMLADSARVISRPELVIFHDAVMGKHGATISSVPESEAEYLAARGISSENIKKMYATIFESQLCDLVLTK
jgi:Fe-S cluster assembly scaffold protein SufB